MQLMVTLNKKRILQLLVQGQINEIFISELGWNKFQREQAITVDGNNYVLHGVSEKSGFAIYECYAEINIDYGTRKKISDQLAKTQFEHLIIFRINNIQHWQWVRREKGTTTVARTESFNPTIQNGEKLYQKLEKLYVSWEEDDNFTITDAKQRVKDAFNKDKVTKKFYDEFKKQKNIFSSFIQGIQDTVNKDWYSSLMLNRLMFVYFIQKKGFLNNDQDYMRTKLTEVKSVKGNNKFYSFYRNFLLVLFHEGFAQEINKRSPEIRKIIGDIPYLNGGLFDTHEIEHNYNDIQINDEAFEKIFNFFDKYEWHLDDRPISNDNQINPDVIGHIFEKYINQKQMGAYYTKEDITEYISKNTIIPYLFECAKEKCSIAFKEDSYIWQMLRDNPDKYIYDAIKKGCELELPEKISCGINDFTRREIWNQTADEEYALPTEIWRETVERRNKYFKIKNKLKDGDISSINDFITYNLDIKQFIQDIISNAESPDVIKAFYYSIAGYIGNKSNEKDIPPISILDPTCGSGAFLFAGLNILEPLYDACIERMYQFKSEHPEKYESFGKIIDNVEKHPNREYFICKSIILNNLYGVDIMKEATEIAKLRLFLKLASCAEVNKQKENYGIEALPDIDFNIRAGNSLVGFANYEEIKYTVEHNNLSGQMNLLSGNTMDIINEKAQKVSLAYRRFKDSQIVSVSHEHIVSAKRDLQERLNNLNNELNHYMAKKYGIQDEIPEKYNTWLNSHEPFNWFVEFYDVIHNRGGFDVIIGNPPYVVYTKKNKDTKKSIADIYKLKNYKTIESDNLYVYTIERSLQILNKNKRFGMIVPLSILCATNMESIRNLLSSDLCTHYSSYEIRPAKLFEGVDQRLTIFISYKSNNPIIYTTKINRWVSEHREYLFNTLTYSPSVNNLRIWRFGNSLDYEIYKKIQTHKPIRNNLALSNNYLHYRSAGLRYWIIFLNNGFDTDSASNKQKGFSSEDSAKFYMAVLNSNLYWWYYSINFDMFNLSDSNIFDFCCNYAPTLNLKILAEDLESDLNNNKKRLITNKKNGEINESFAFQKKKSKSIIDKIDKILAEHYGFTNEELDYIINYDIKYRMGDSLNGSDDE